MADILNAKLAMILNEKNSKITPGNIKKDVTIFDVTGTYEGGGSTDPYVFPTFDYSINVNNLQNIAVGTHIRCRLLTETTNPDIHTTTLTNSTQTIRLSVQATSDGNSWNSNNKYVQIMGRAFTKWPVCAYFKEKTGKQIPEILYGDYLVYIDTNIVNTFGISVDVDYTNNPGWYKYSNDEYMGETYTMVSNDYINEFNEEHFKLENIISSVQTGNAFNIDCQNIGNFIQVEIIND